MGERGLWVGTVLGILVVVATMLPAHAASAAAPGAPPVSREVAGPVSVEIARTVGAQARPTSDGGFNVRLANGRVLHTHGPDARMGDVEGGPGSLPSTAPQRSPVCASDYYQHLLYARRPTTTDSYATAATQIRTIFKQINHILNRAGGESSAGVKTADYKVKCDGAGQIEVGAFTTTSTAFSDVASAAASAGYNLPNVDYTIFFDQPATSACGIGSLYPDERLVVGNANNNEPGTGSGYALTYGGPSSGSANCWTTTTPMHENGHNQGAVQGPVGANLVGAPHSTGDGGHCNDGMDVMCYADGGSTSNYDPNVCPTEGFDCNFDDYFDAAPEPSEYLSSYWNLGSSLNRFIRLGLVTPQVRFSAATYRYRENAGSALLTLKRDGDPSSAFDVALAVGPSTATTADFTDPADTVIHFEAGETTKALPPIAIANDLAEEAAERFTSTLSSPTNGVTLGPIPATTVWIDPSDQQPDGYIKLSGGPWRGSNVYNTTAANQTITTGARRGQTRTFYAVIQNDGNVRNAFTVRAANTSGTSFLANGSSWLASALRRTSGVRVNLDPGKTYTFRLDFKMGSAASGTESLTVLSSWLTGDRLIHDRIRANVRI